MERLSKKAQKIWTFMSYQDERVIGVALERFKPRVSIPPLLSAKNEETDGMLVENLHPGVRLPIPEIGVAKRQTGGGMYASADNVRAIIMPGAEFS